MNIAELTRLHEQKLINFTKLAKLSGLNYQSLIQKIRRGSELRVNEANAITKALELLKSEETK